MGQAVNRDAAAFGLALERHLHRVMILVFVLIAAGAVYAGGSYLLRADPGPSDTDCFTYALRIDGGSPYPGDRERFARCFD